MECLLFTVCVMSGARRCLQTRPGKDGEAPSNAAFVWTGGGGSVFGDGFLTKQFHLSLIRLQAAQQCEESGTVMFSGLVVGDLRICGACSPGGVSVGRTKSGHFHL